MNVSGIGDPERISESADWMELSVLLSARSQASKSDLVRSREILRDSDRERVELDFGGLEGEDRELAEEEILESESEDWAADVREELMSRSTGLGGKYPFVIRSSRQAWTLSSEFDKDRPDHLFYVCCLIITGCRYGTLAPRAPELDKIFQIISYLVAGRAVQGESFWFGYPRPDSSNMKVAVERLLDRMGFELPKIVPPPWSVDTENDEGIDVVAWRDFHDKLSPQVVLYGQVASGKNWEGKAVSEHVEARFKPWLANYGQRFYLPAIFIPWPQYATVEGTRGRSFRQRVREIAVRQEKQYGLMLDRGRITELALEHADSSLGEEEEELLLYLRNWMQDALNLGADPTRSE